MESFLYFSPIHLLYFFSRECPQSFFTLQIGRHGHLTFFPLSFLLTSPSKNHIRRAILFRSLLRLKRGSDKPREPLFSGITFWETITHSTLSSLSELGYPRLFKKLGTVRLHNHNSSGPLTVSGLLRVSDISSFRVGPRLPVLVSHTVFLQGFWVHLTHCVVDPPLVRYVPPRSPETVRKGNDGVLI